MKEQHLILGCLKAPFGMRPFRSLWILELRERSEAVLYRFFCGRVHMCMFVKAASISAQPLDS